MHPVQQHLFDTNFKDLAGTRLEGTIALSDELINLGIMDFLADLKSGNSGETVGPVAPSVAPAASPLPDPKALLALLDVEHLKFRTEKGKAVLEVKVGVK